MMPPYYATPLGQNHKDSLEHAAEMRRYYQDIEERTAPEQKEVNA